MNTYIPGKLEEALTAVIELHQPILSSEVKLCKECTSISPSRVKYPCRTIKEIKAVVGEELGL